MGAVEAELRFEPIDLDSAAETAVTFRADSFACSFGSPERFYEADGKGHERYLVWLRQRMQSIPGSCVHVWTGDTIIGQIEMGQFKGDPEAGYVYLYYLLPAHRNRGLGRCLDEHAAAFLRGMGFQRARLNVSPTNPQAMRFYVKNGWRDLGPTLEQPEVHAMEKSLVASGSVPMTDNITLRQLDNEPAAKADLQRVLEAAPTYFEMVTGSLPKANEAQTLFEALPKRASPEDKAVFGIYEDDEMVGCADIIRGFPDRATTFIGLFLIAEPWQRRGIGSAGYRLLEKIVGSSPDCLRISLAVVRTNLPALTFWRRLGYVVTGDGGTAEHGSAVSTTIVLSKNLA